MLRKTKRVRVEIAIAAGLLLVIASALAIRKLVRGETVGLITGAIIAENADSHLQRPIGNAHIVAESGTAIAKAGSESSGLFRLRLHPPVETGEIVKLRVEHPDYQQKALATPASEQIYVIRLTPNARQAGVPPARKETRISNIRVRYATHSTSTTTVGTAVRTFDIVNTGNVPCERRPPCSPDGKWKATVGSLSLDTEEQNKQFRNVRVSCIAGPCPFTAIEEDRFSRGGRAISVSVRNWSDPVTYLLEAEVAQTMESELVRYTYPVTFGRSMNFTLPAAASGPSIEADVGGSEIVFPLGPELRLSWATCRFESGSDGTKQYRCELKPGYQFD
ncbi:MAG: carboxypeptidase regulatory-like domain-containing protein [Bryobacteraceae bacterium]